ncbi:MAG: DUF2244 domain-containing protein [Pseudomonadota bacterium]
MPSRRIANDPQLGHETPMSRRTPMETMPPTVTGRAGAEALRPVAGDDDLAFHAFLYPNRSLTWGGFRQVMAVIIGVNLVNALIYFTLGAWPVAFFCGVDILLVWLAFKLSYTQGKRHERIMLTDDALWVSRVLPSGHETRWKLDPVGAQASIDKPIAHESHLKLTERGKTLIVGSFLSPKERGELADALGAALSQFRSGQTL